MVIFGTAALPIVPYRLNTNCAPLLLGRKRNEWAEIYNKLISGQRQAWWKENKCFFFFFVRHLTIKWAA